MCSAEPKAVCLRLLGPEKRVAPKEQRFLLSYLRCADKLRYQHSAVSVIHGAKVLGKAAASARQREMRKTLPLLGHINPPGETREVVTEGGIGGSDCWKQVFLDSSEALLAQD